MFHLAGSLDDPWRSKRDVLLHLRATVEADLWVLFSSVSAVIPGLDTGLEAYAAANRWLEEHARSTPGTIAIAWAPWAGEGMAAAHAEAFRARGLTPIDPAEAMDLMEWALSAGASNVLVMERPPEVAPVAGAAERVRAILREELGADVPDDVPFTSLGVDSLLALEIVRRIEAALGRELPPTLLFEHPTLGGLLGALEGRAPTTPLPIPGDALLPSQETFLVQRRYFPDIPGNVFLGVTLDPPIGRAALEAALARTVARHVSLRSVVRGREQVQGGALPSVNWGPVDEDAILREPFDLATGPLLRVHADGRRLVLNAHHLAVDAWSLKNVLEELLEDRPAPAADWPAAAAALRAQIPDTAAYARRFADGIPPLPLGRPGATPSGPPGVLHTHHELPPLEAEARALGVTLPALVLAAYVRRLWRWTGQRDVVVRVAHGRRGVRVPAVDRIVGSFADSLPVRVEADHDLSILAPRVQEALRALPDAPSTVLAGLARADAPVGLTPAGFSFPLLPASTGPFRVSEVRGASASGFTGLGLIAWTWEGRLHCSWNWLASHFERQEVERFASGLFADRFHLRILARCRAHPDRPAVGALTYGQLDRRSAAVARRLRGSLVAVIARPGPEAVIAVLAALRSGAAYVPLDPDWPEARIARILEVARPDCVLRADEIGDEEADDGPLERGSRAWVMFTSGSTGTPKGVEVSHESALMFLEWVQEALGVTEGDRFVQTSSLAFGGSIRQMFSPLLAGARCLPAPPGLFRDPDAAVRFLDEEGITLWNSVPSLWMRLLDACARTGAELRSVRWVLVGGEAVPSAHLARWRAQFGGRHRVANLYGSTETVVNATWWEATTIPEGPLCPIGTARAGVAVELDGEEIVVRGAIAEGYLGGPRFGGVYRTGDVGMRRADGTLVYVGRRDTQVQVHGNRVEMGEVEATLCAHPAVAAAAVRFDGERLNATVELREPVEPSAIRTWLAARLPGHAVPARIETGSIPRTIVGKTDRRGGDLPVREAVRRVLALDRLPGSDEDFFALGGDSISLLDLLDALRDAGLEPPRATALYAARTPREMAARCGASAPKEATTLTSAQRGFLLAHRLHPDRPPTWTAMVPLRGPLDPDRFAAALDEVVRRHAILRTVYDPEPRVVSARARLQYDDLEGLDALETRWREACGTRFDLARAPLFRARLCRLADDDHRLILTAHHVVADAWSAWILAGELLAIHDGLELPAPDPLPAEASGDAAWWSGTLAGLDQPPGESGEAEATVTVPTVSHARLLRETLLSIAEVTGREDVVVATALSGRDSRRSRAVGPLAVGVPVRCRAPFLDVAARFAEAVAHAPAVAPPSQLPSLGRFFLSWLDPSTVPVPSTSLTIAWPEGRYRFAAPSTGTEAMIGALVGASGVTLHLTGGPLVHRLAAVLERRLRAVDAALVIYAPAGTPLPIIEPVVVERVETVLGSSELVLLPVTADRLDAADLPAAVRATEARVVALAGMLPATSGLGARALWEGPPVLTTGHAATVVAMVKTIERALARTGGRWEDLRLGVLGYGSIGRAVVELAVERLGPPREIRVRDPRVRMDDLSDVDWILGATSGGVAIDVGALRPGTVVIDDSFPRAFDEGAARSRMERDGDVLLVGGGMLDAGPLVRTSPFPEAESMRSRYGARWLPGCHAEAILVAADPALGPTIGPVTPERARRVWEAVERAGWAAAPLHLGGWVVPDVSPRSR